MIVAALALAFYGLSTPISGAMNALLGIAAPVIGGLFIAITLVLLVADLKRPDRALFLITKANPTSWLVWGGIILAIFGLIEAAWFELPSLVRLRSCACCSFLPRSLERRRQATRLSSLGRPRGAISGKVHCCCQFCLCRHSSRARQR